MSKKILGQLKDFGNDLNRSLKETQAASVLLGNTANPYAQALGAALGSQGYGGPRRKGRKPGPKPKKAGGKKKPKTAAQKRAAKLRAMKKKMMQGGFSFGGLGNFFKNVASVPIYAASGALGGLNGGIQNL